MGIDGHIMALHATSLDNNVYVTRNNSSAAKISVSVKQFP